MFLMRQLTDYEEGFLAFTTLLVNFRFFMLKIGLFWNLFMHV
jgi:hypothetical protein